MKALLRNGLATAFAAVALGAFAAAPAQADPDTDFANELHVYGIYGPKGLPKEVADKMATAHQKHGVPPPDDVPTQAQ